MPERRSSMESLNVFRITKKNVISLRWIAGHYYISYLALHCKKVANILEKWKKSFFSLIFNIHHITVVIITLHYNVMCEFLNVISMRVSNKVQLACIKKVDV